LVTFIACEFVTAAGITEILGYHPAVAGSLREPPRRHFRSLRLLLPCGNAASDCKDEFPD
jgi:hypothetical protein